MDGSQMRYEVTAQELRAFVERIEQLRAEQADLKADEKEVFAEMKGRGYMTRPIRTIIKRRAADPAKLAEEEAVMDIYMAALRMT